MHQDTGQPCKRARVDDIITLASRIWGLPREVITGKSRRRIHVRPRQAVYLVAREHGHSLPQIAKLCGGRDHSSVIHGLAQAKIWEDHLPIYAEMVRQLRRDADRTGPFVHDRKRQCEMQTMFRSAVESVKRATARIETKETAPKSAKKPRNIFDNSDFVKESLAVVSIELSNRAFVNALLAELGGIAKRQAGRVMIG